MRMSELQSFHCATLLLSTLAIAGVAQTLWFKSKLSAHFAYPLDGGATFRSRRVFGDNKTLKGFVVVIPVGALACAILGPLFLSAGLSVWSLSAFEYFCLGGLAAFGLMIGELPNSFIKRQLDIAPGEMAERDRGQSLWRVFGFLADRFDSVLGVLAIVTIAIPTPFGVWLWAFVLGPPLHWSFSFALYALGVKKRPA